MTERSTKQVLVVRTKYPDGKGGLFKPRTGKIAAQCAHASMKVLLDRMVVSSVDGYPAVKQRTLTCFLDENIGTAIDHWITGSFTKICVSVASEEELDAIYQKAREAGLPASLIVDNGYTEFKGVPTKTVVAIGPAWCDEIDPITSHLPLL